jgi:hypothetical protein
MYISFSLEMRREESRLITVFTWGENIRVNLTEIERNYENIVYIDVALNGKYL